MSLGTEYKYFQNRSCEYYPCHDKLERINCLFCFCPIYDLADCGGEYRILESGVKDCSRCRFIHTEAAYDIVVQKLKDKNKEKRGVSNENSNA